MDDHLVGGNQKTQFCVGWQHGAVPEIEAQRFLAVIADGWLNLKGRFTRLERDGDAGVERTPIARSEDHNRRVLRVQLQWDVAPRHAPIVAVFSDRDAPFQPTHGQPALLLLWPPCCRLDDIVLVEHLPSARLVHHLPDAPTQLWHHHHLQVLVFQHQQPIAARRGFWLFGKETIQIEFSVGPIENWVECIALVALVRVGGNRHAAFVIGDSRQRRGGYGRRDRRRCNRRKDRCQRGCRCGDGLAFDGRS
jgi:hypothetical protein